MNSGRMLVFGGSGQLGCELSRGSSHGFAVDALSRANADITSENSIREALAQYRAHIVVNAAAYTQVDLAEKEREAADRTNRAGAGLLAKVCDEAGLPLIHISTDYVFDGSKTGAYLESDPIAPVNYYGKTKADGEDEVRRHARQHVILRVSWLYGEFGKNFLKTMLRLGTERDSVSVVDDQFGCPTSTRDLAGAIQKVASSIREQRAGFGTYHFAGDGVTNWHGFAAAIFEKAGELTGRNVKLSPIKTAQYPTPARRPINSVLDCAKFERQFGFKGRPWRDEAREIVEAVIRTGKSLA